MFFLRGTVPLYSASRRLTTSSILLGPSVKPAAIAGFVGDPPVFERVRCGLMRLSRDRHRGPQRDRVIEDDGLTLGRALLPVAPLSSHTCR